MGHLVVNGGKQLNGRLEPSANKNAILPVLCGTLLAGGPVLLRNVPEITDVQKLLAFFSEIGSIVEFDRKAKTLRLDHSSARFHPDTHSLPAGMRSSVMLIPPLLIRFGSARIPGDVKGCSLGSREIDPHIDLMRTFGIAFDEHDDGLHINAPRHLTPAQHWLDYASVTTTENFVLCAARAAGESVLMNAASEPHVQEFCRFMSAIGAVIEGAGTSRLRVTGVDELGGCDGFEFEEDFHEVATFLALGAITRGQVSIRNSRPDHFPLIDRTLAKFNVSVEHKDGWSRSYVDGDLTVRKPFTQHILPKVEAAPWPYLPVDLLPIFVALGVRASGNMMFWNKVYDGAFGWSAELSKFGAHAVQCDPHRLIVFGGLPLSPASVDSPYIIRVAIGLLMIATSIPGVSVIRNADPIRRAHPHFAENLRLLGADVEWQT